MKIRQISPNDPVTNIVLDAFEEEAPIFNDIEAYQVGGNADSLEKAGDGKSQASIFRDVNNHEERARPTYGDVPVTKKIVSGDSGVDKVYEQRNVDIVSKLESNTKRDAKEDAKVFRSKIWTGDSATESDEIDGIHTLTPAARIETLDNAIILPLGGDAAKQYQQEFFEKFILTHVNMPWNEFFAYMPESWTLRLVTAAKNLGYYKEIDTPVGKAVKIGKAIIKSYGYDAAGNELFAPSDQGVPGSNLTSTFTYVKWGEEENLTMATSKGLVGEYLGLVKKIYTNTWDLDANLVLQNDKALYQIKGFGLKFPA